MYLLKGNGHHADYSSSGQDAEKDAQPNEMAVEQACERMILETVRLLQEGQLDQAEYLLQEGAAPTSCVGTDCSPAVHKTWLHYHNAALPLLILEKPAHNATLSKLATI